MEELEPTIDEIKKIANAKRQKKPSQYNEFVKQQMETFKGQNIDHKEKMKLVSIEWKKQKEPQGAEEDLSSLPLPPPKPIIIKKKRVNVKQPKIEPIEEPIKEPIKEPVIIDNSQVSKEIKPSIDYDELHNDIELLKEMLRNQNIFIQETLKPIPRAKPKPKPKPKQISKTLDLTINDNDINNIINNIPTDIKKQEPKQDEKVKAFLDALLKK